MPRTLQRLSTLALARASKPGYLADGGGLYLHVSTAGGKSWAFRFAIDGRKREMGLGPYPAVSLAAARVEAGKARAFVKLGVDPIAEREARRLAARLAEMNSISFEGAARAFITVHEGTWKNPKHRQQWRNTLKTYVYPKIGKLSVRAVGTAEVTRILDPIWHEKPETASRVRGRIELIWDWSKVRGYCSGENPARWRGHLDKVYPSKEKVRKVRHHAAVPIDDMPTVYARLREIDGIAALAARFTNLTAVRVSVTTGGTVAEVANPEIWSISAERMKAERGHNVPLSGEAKAVLEEAAALRADDRLFPGHKADKPLSHTAVIKALRSAGAGRATTHGCRSTFKDWASERTSFPGEVSEMVLAHAVGDKTEAAYRRGELLTKRAAMMEAWAGFVSTPRHADNVVELARAAAA